MPKRPHTVRPRPLTFSMPEDLRAKVELMLFSEVDGRVPHGKYKEYLCGLIREDFARRSAHRAGQVPPVGVAQEDIKAGQLIVWDPDTGRLRAAPSE